MTEDKWVVVMHLATRSVAWRNRIAPTGAGPGLGTELHLFDTRESAEQHRDSFAWQMAGDSEDRFKRQQARNEVMPLIRYLIEYGYDC